MKKIIGIDLGTTYSAIATLDDLGNPEIIPNPENNNKITRSAVYIGKDNAIVGDKALEASITEPKKVAKKAKIKMADEVVFSTKEGEWIDGKKGYTPSQVSSLVLSKLKDYTSGVKKAVITVPAHFAEASRAATLDAAKLAGLEAELINEPTAAVLHYANLPGVKVSGRVLIFDLGGGTFDITIAKVKDKKVDVITSRGDIHLGGENFDEELIKIIDKKYKKAKGKGLNVKDSKLAQTAEKIKKILSSKEKVTEIVEGPKGPHKIEIKKEEFEESIDTYLEKIKMLMEEALEGAKCKPSNISQSLLVGGSSRIPIVSKIITKIMKKAPVKGVNVDEAVALGAAIYAGLQNKTDLNSAQKKAMSKVELQDVVGFNMGTIARIQDPEKGWARVNITVIPRDTPKPCSETQELAILADDQEKINCTVTQSEGEEKEIDFVEIIAEKEMNLGKGRKAGEPIKVTYSYDANETMHCVFEDVSKKKKVELSLKPEGSKTIKELKESLDFEIE